jgi:hypothetical protein
LLNVDEAGLLHPRFIHLAHVRAHGSTELLRGLAQQLAP